LLVIYIKCIITITIIFPLIIHIFISASPFLHSLYSFKFISKNLEINISIKLPPNNPEPSPLQKALIEIHLFDSSCKSILDRFICKYDIIFCIFFISLLSLLL
jgi:hypothetical protein